MGGPGDGGQHDGHAGCKGDLVCGSNNCLQFGAYYHPKDDCCEKPKNKSEVVEAPFNPFKNNIHPTYFRPIDKRCAGRHIDKGVCCSPETPCTLGEGDCENDNDCRDDLVCGNNNCKQFAAYFDKKDDCCVKPESTKAAINSIFEWAGWGAWTVDAAGERRRLRFQRAKQVIVETTPTTTTELDPNIPFLPKEGQRCSGRNYQGRRCCTPENPCDEGEGDCDGPGDGGQHDGHRGCRGDLVCGSNNCLQFGAYYHPKDDCCERPQGGGLAGGLGSGGVRQQTFGWGPWSDWTACRRVHNFSAGRCRKVRTRKCVGQQCGSSLQHSEDLQEQYCRESDCE